MKLGATLLNILKAALFAALFTWIGVQLLGCTPHTLDECVAKYNVRYAYSVLDCTQVPGCRIEAHQLNDLRSIQREYPQCFTEHFP